MKKRTTLIFFFFILRNFVYADTAPHFSNHVTIQICNKGLNVEKGLNVLFLEYREDNNGFDTINNRNSTAAYWMGTTVRALEGNKWLLTSHSDFQPFKLIMVYNGQTYQSDLIKIHGGNNLYVFRIKNGKIINVSPVFYQPWQEYFISLGLTLLIELIIGIFLFRKEKIPLKKGLIILFFINMMTHPLLTFIYSHLTINLLILELGVILLEAGLLKIFLNKENINSKWALKTSVILNAASFILGGAILLFFEYS